jgi:hypothetical protein
LKTVAAILLLGILLLLISIKLAATHLAYHNDSIELLCIANQATLNLRRSGEEYFRGVNDIQRVQQESGHSNPTKSKSKSKSSVTDPYSVKDLFRIGDPSFTLNPEVDQFPTRLPAPFRAAGDRPPASAILCA